MASGAPHLCYWRLGRLDRHTPRTNDPATWRNIRHLESKTSRLRRSATRGIRHDTQHVKSQNMSKLPSCIKTTMLDTFYTDSNGTFCLSAVRRHADEVQRRTHCWPSHHGKMAWGLRHRHHDGLFCWGGTWLATGVFLGKKTHVFLAFGSQVGILILGSCIV